MEVQQQQRVSGDGGRRTILQPLPYSEQVAFILRRRTYRIKSRWATANVKARQGLSLQERLRSIEVVYA